MDFMQKQSDIVNWNITCLRYRLFIFITIYVWTYSLSSKIIYILREKNIENWIMNMCSFIAQSILIKNKEYVPTYPQNEDVFLLD